MLTAEVEIGRIYEGKVVRITDFGAFVELLPGKDGLVHVSELSTERVESVEDAVQMGDVIKVKVISVDPTGKVRLSRKAVLAEELGIPYEESQRPSGGGGRGGDRGGRGGDRDRGGRGGDRGGRSGGGGHDRDRSGRADRPSGGDRPSGDRPAGGDREYGFRERPRSKENE